MPKKSLKELFVIKKVIANRFKANRLYAEVTKTYFKNKSIHTFVKEKDSDVSFGFCTSNCRGYAHSV